MRQVLDSLKVEQFRASFLVQQNLRRQIIDQLLGLVLYGELSGVRSRQRGLRFTGSHHGLNEVVSRSLALAKELSDSVLSKL